MLVKAPFRLFSRLRFFSRFRKHDQTFDLSFMRSLFPLEIKRSFVLFDYPRTRLFETFHDFWKLRNLHVCTGVRARSWIWVFDTQRASVNIRTSKLKGISTSFHTHVGQSWLPLAATDSWNNAVINHLPPLRNVFKIQCSLVTVGVTMSIKKRLGALFCKSIQLCQKRGSKKMFSLPFFSLF